MNLAGIVHAALITNCCFFQGEPGTSVFAPHSWMVYWWWTNLKFFKSTFDLCGECTITQPIITQNVFREISQEKGSTVWRAQWRSPPQEEFCSHLNCDGHWWHRWSKYKTPNGLPNTTNNLLIYQRNQLRKTDVVVHEGKQEGKLSMNVQCVREDSGETSHKGNGHFTH